LRRKYSAYLFYIYSRALRTLECPDGKLPGPRAVGVGWCKEEVTACGYTFEDRDEILDIMKKLWTEPVALGVDRLVPLLGSDEPDLARRRIDDLVEIANTVGG